MYVIPQYVSYESRNLGLTDMKRWSWPHDFLETAWFTATVHIEGQCYNRDNHITHYHTRSKQSGSVQVNSKSVGNHRVS